MSSPQRMRMFGLSVLGIAVSSRWLMDVSSAFAQPGASGPGASGETHQHGEEGEQANEDEQDADSENRRVHRLLGRACDRRKGLVPQVMHAPPIFPNRDDKRE